MELGLNRVYIGGPSDFYSTDLKADRQYILCNYKEKVFSPLSIVSLVYKDYGGFVIPSSEVVPSQNTYDIDSEESRLRNKMKTNLATQAKNDEDEENSVRVSFTSDDYNRPEDFNREEDDSEDGVDKKKQEEQRTIDLAVLELYLQKLDDPKTKQNMLAKFKKCMEFETLLMNPNTDLILKTIHGDADVCLKYNNVVGAMRDLDPEIPKIYRSFLLLLNYINEKNDHKFFKEHFAMCASKLSSELSILEELINFLCTRKRKPIISLEFFSELESDLHLTGHQ